MIRLIWTLAIPSACYLCAALEYLMNGEKGMALAFASYALANVGFIWAAAR